MAFRPTFSVRAEAMLNVRAEGDLSIHTGNCQYYYSLCKELCKFRIFTAVTGGKEVSHSVSGLLV